MKIRLTMLAMLSVFSPVLFAASVDDTVIQQQQNIFQQQREQQLREQMQPERDVRLPVPQTTDTFKPSSGLPIDDGICFPIQKVNLVSDEVNTFRFALKHALNKSQFKAGKCLNAQDINQIMSLAQNKVIDRGYTTTRILAAPQNLQSGVLELTVLAGFIKDFKVNQSDNQQTHADRIAAFQNEFPTNHKKLLNLRDLEQGLENLKRIPTAEADIQITPSEQPNESTVVIQWQQRLLPYRLTASIDDSGSKSTGKLQGNLTLSADNLFGLSDMAYVSVGRALGNVPDVTDSSGRKIKGKTHNYALHYSVPVGNWLWSINRSQYRYHRAVAGYQESYDYNGESLNSDVGFSRLIYRDAKRKSYLGAKLWQRETRNYINDAEVSVQRRNTAGWSVDFSHKEYLDDATLSVKVGYKRGTGMNNALPAPEEAFNEGTSRMKVITADVNLNLPFAIKKFAFSYDASVHGQWNKTSLTPQDKIAIGGRYTVRGFDGESSLSAERGWYWRNELAWTYRQNHQFYLGADVGHVSGQSAKYLLGQTLAGGVVGLRGQFKAGGALSYDLFASKALQKPDYFQTKSVVTGFNLSYSF